MSNNRQPLVKPKAVPNLNRQGGGAPKIDNSLLVKAMEVFKADPTASSQNVFIRQLFKSRLFVPCEKKAENPKSKEVQLRFLLLKNKEGESVLGAFTDWSQIKKQQNPPKEAAAVPFPEIVKIASQQKDIIKGVIINPFEHGIFLDEKALAQIDENLKKAAEKIKASQGGAGASEGEAGEEGELIASIPAGSLLNGAKKEEEGDILYIGEPLEEPYELTREFSKYFKSVKGVQSAYYLLIYRSEKGEPSPLVVIDFKGDKDTKDNVYKEIESIYNEKAENDAKLTIMSAGEKLAKDGIINKKPFYQRKVFGIF